jgi:hypothetical protein
LWPSACCTIKMEMPSLWTREMVRTQKKYEDQWKNRWLAKGFPLQNSRLQDRIQIALWFSLSSFYFYFFYPLLSSLEPPYIQFGGLYMWFTWHTNVILSILVHASL